MVSFGNSRALSGAPRKDLEGLWASELIPGPGIINLYECRSEANWET